MGSGTANNRTTKQIKLAKQYTQQIKDKAADHFMLVDASVNGQEDDRTLMRKKIEKTGLRGYGGIHMNKTKNKIEGYFHKTMDTIDAKKAGLQGIATAVDVAKQMPKDKILILCDCKNAVNYSNKSYIAPFKCVTLRI